MIGRRGLGPHFFDDEARDFIQENEILKMLEYSVWLYVEFVLCQPSPALLTIVLPSTHSHSNHDETNGAQDRHCGEHRSENGKGRPPILLKETGEAKRKCDK
ncbi:hypothetical protein BH23PLA1_BH23PLA1_31970 [soil metagenome]